MKTASVIFYPKRSVAHSIVFEAINRRRSRVRGVSIGFSKSVERAHTHVIGFTGYKPFKNANEGVGGLIEDRAFCQLAGSPREII